MRHEPASIFFLTRPLHRERQRDTIVQLPEGFRAVLPPAPAGANVPDHEVNRRLASSLRGRLARGLRRWSLNLARMPAQALSPCALVYTWGKIPLSRCRARFVVELDNPYVLTLYGGIGALRRSILRRLLLGPSCAGIVCISEACRNSTALALGPDLAAKTRVVYPYMSRREQAEPGKATTLELVFVGSQFWLKGGYELCEAFRVVADEVGGVHLTVIANADEAVRREYAGSPISFLQASLGREEVAARLAEADLFVMPTLVESFGMAALEALAHGLPLLTTNVYALPELVRHGVNGFLIEDPFGCWDQGRLNRVVLREPDLEAYFRGRRFPQLREQLKANLRILLSDRSQLTAMGAQSRKLFEERFAPEVRARSFSDAIDAFIGERTPS